MLIAQLNPTTAPDITIDATVGQIIVSSTSTPTATATSNSTSTTSTQTPTASPNATSLPTVKPTPAPTTAPIYSFSKALSIYGYGPVNSDILLFGFGVYSKTTSDNKGFFRFNNIYSYTFYYPELCIQAVDSKKRVSQPNCIAGLPKNRQVPLEVGPVLLSPTISLGASKTVLGQSNYVNGRTTPNTKVNIYLSNKDKYMLPVLNTVSDENGDFDINVSVSDAARYIVFASTTYADNLSAKSNTLNFEVSSSSKTFWESLSDYITKNKIMALIFVEVVVFVLLFVSVLKRTTKAHK